MPYPLGHTATTHYFIMVPSLEKKSVSKTPYKIQKLKKSRPWQDSNLHPQIRSLMPYPLGHTATTHYFIMVPWLEKKISLKTPYKIQKLKKNRPWQDSNLQSSDPKSDALSIRPHGHHLLPWLFLLCLCYNGSHEKKRIYLTYDLTYPTLLLFKERGKMYPKGRRPTEKDGYFESNIWVKTPICSIELHTIIFSAILYGCSVLPAQDHMVYHHFSLVGPMQILYTKCEALGMFYYHLLYTKRQESFSTSKTERKVLTLQMEFTAIQSQKLLITFLLQGLFAYNGLFYLWANIYNLH